jgi:hypothetical protein
MPMPLWNGLWPALGQLDIGLSRLPAFENFHHGGKGPDRPFSLDRRHWRLLAWRAFGLGLLGHGDQNHVRPQPSSGSVVEKKGPGPHEAHGERPRAFNPTPGAAVLFRAKPPPAWAERPQCRRSRATKLAAITKLQAIEQIILYRNSQPPSPKPVPRQLQARIAR